MKICTLASSSKANCTLIWNDSTKLLIDIGVQLKDLEEKLKILKIDPSEITAILNTHEHSDHTKNIGAFMRKYKTPLFCHVDGYEKLLTKLGNVNTRLITQFGDMSFAIGDFYITPFKLPHDSISCVGYTVQEGENRMSIATDLGHIDDEIISHLIGSKMVILESNHDEKMLINNPNYSPMLKQRILGKSGHLSNKVCSETVLRLARTGTKQILLAHLSEENNTPEVAYNCVCNFLYKYGIMVGEHINIDVAPCSTFSNVYVLK